MNKAVKIVEPRPTTAEAQEANGEAHPEEVLPLGNSISFVAGDVNNKPYQWWTEYQQEKQQTRVFARDTAAHRKRNLNTRYQIYPPYFSHDPTDTDKGEPLRKGDLVIDFDDADDPGRALAEVRLIINHMEEVHGLPPHAWRAWVSGGKGFHLLLNARWLGLDKPSSFLPKYFKKVVNEELVMPLGLQTVDQSLYCMKSGKPLRRENIERETGRYKVPVTIEELMHEPCEDLLALADTPRRVDEVPIEWKPLSLLDRVKHWVAQIDGEDEMLKMQTRSPGLIQRVLKDINAPACIELIIADTSDTDPSCRDFNRIAQTLTRFCLMKGLSAEASVDLCRPFIDGYQYSSSLTTPKLRLENFINRYNSMADDHLPGFACGYVRGLKIAGVKEKCQSCPVMRLPLAEVLKALDDLAAQDDLNTDNSDAWCRAIHDAKPDAIKLVKMLKDIDRRLGGGIAAVKKVYNAYEERADRAAALQAEAETSEGEIEYDALSLSTTVQAAEGALNTIKSADDLDCLRFGDIVSMIVENKPDKSHQQMHRGDEDLPPPIPKLEAYDSTNLHMRLERSALFYTISTNGKKYIPPPPSVINGVLLNKQSTLKQVYGLLMAPCVRHDGTYLYKKGIDEATGLYLHHGWNEADLIPAESVSRADARKMYRKLASLLFFETEFGSELDEAVLIGEALTLLQRKVMDIAPGFRITASMQESGKTTTQKILYYMMTGHELPPSALSSDRDEAEKQMLSILIENRLLTCFDNLKDGTTLDNEVLSRAITSPDFTGRWLGKNRQVTVPSKTVFSVTGNNIKVGSDLVSRMIECQIICSSGDPKDREFQEKDVMGYIRGVRIEAIRLALGIVAGYLCSVEMFNRGKTSRFPAWDKMVRHPIMWASDIDLVDAFVRGEDDNEERSATAVLVEALLRTFKTNDFKSLDVREAIPVGNRGKRYIDCDLSMAIDGCCDYYDPNSVKGIGHVISRQIGKVTSVGTLRVKQVEHKAVFHIEIPACDEECMV